ncbi:hypothetical protein [Deinococcus sp. AJ005]|uniref:hypothetical protein n=1 Tax=Deinococcus sp. AJ005 TaxID=2652443 RepID=UPI00125CA5F6|nr:hypothetical protein [Deinococcus sp. AJ005]QFP76014.1 hypothetical protein DAAJ005_05765 [Deinococcus sp. AJ005]
MTQSAQSERAQTALKTSGITDVPLMSLEREDALFVLTGDLLIYQDGGGTRRVTLRDLTRIHSDQAGLLRVETPAGTALTASLLGFDVAQVQTFFKGVRSATARAKDLPDSPTPTPGGAKTFGSAPAVADGAVAGGAVADGEAKAQNTQAHTDSAATVSDATVPEMAGMPAASGSPDAGPQTGESAKASAPASSSPDMQGAAPEQDKAPEDSKTQTPAAAGSTLSASPATAGAATPTLPPTASSESTKTGGSAENPVVISSSSFSPNVSKPGLGAVVAAKVEAVRSDITKPGTAKPETSKADVSRVGAPQAELSKPELRKGQTAAPLSDIPADQAASRIELPNRPIPRSAVAVPGNTAPDSPKPELQAVSDPMPTAAPPVTALSKVAAATALARQAGTVEGLAGRLKLLGAVLFVAALALAFFQFTGDQALAGIWTLLSGGVGAIALLALGELSALLALMARVPGPARTTAHDG